MARILVIAEHVNHMKGITIKRRAAGKDKCKNVH
jgi:hypothetical protein